MATAEDFKRSLNAIKEQVWAIVYAYDPPLKPRSLWYDRWRYDVINDYVEAVSFLGAEPLIIDVDNFVCSRRLESGEIDIAINLNSGATPISNIGLVPSVAQWHDVPCFPNPADVLLSGERKDICKIFFRNWFNVPSDIDLRTARGGHARFIIKPKTLGNSQQVETKLPPTILSTDEDQPRLLRETIIEEFIEGYEVTTPVIFDALTEKYIVLPPIVYVPDVADPTNWFLSYEMKMDRQIRVERRIGTLSPAATLALCQSSLAFNFTVLARYDFRWRTREVNSSPIELDKLWFLEINCMPTLRADVNFLKSVKHYIAMHSDFLIDHVKTARTPDVAALAYLLLQFYLTTAKTK